MSAQEEFNRSYITSSEIARRVRVTRSAVIQARQKGILPDPIFVENHIVLWKKEDVEPHIVLWEAKRKERFES
jgi:hypothetical protein